MTDVNEKIKNQEVAITGDEDKIMGHIFWYSISPDVEITREELADIFDQVEIDHAWLPNEIRLVDAFKRATTEVQKKNVPTSDPDITKNFLSRKAFNNNKTNQCNIVVENVDRKSKKLTYQSDGNIVELDKVNETFNIKTLDGDEQAKDLVYEAKNKFDKYIKYYKSQQLRPVVSSILNSLAPTQVRPNGGVYFVPHTYTPELKKLKMLLEELNSEGFILPMFDTSDNRNMVLNKLEKDFDEAINRLKSLQDSNAEKKHITQALKETEQIGKTFNAYAENLKLDMERLEDKRDDLRIAYFKLTQN